ncbi:MAG: Lrp/AsnC family transcriptional regulator [Magnetococcales bacterium]|nr:Lrp/AsnC family transcriptional regulator [Magnetococcales bacterium]
MIESPLTIKIINGLQNGFPIAPHPFAEAATRLDTTEEQLIAAIHKMLEAKLLTRFGPFFNAERMGGGLTLAALRVPVDDYDAVCTLVNQQPEVAHNYAREHELNMWFVVATEHAHEVAIVLARIESLTGLAVFNLPKLEEYRLGFQVHLDENGNVDTCPLPPEKKFTTPPTPPDPVDRGIIATLQTGIPLTPTPYQQVADQLGVPENVILSRLNRMLEYGWVRRIGAAPDHYRLGLKGNGMSVWNVPDAAVSRLGRQIADLDFITHCYRRPRHPPEWLYNLFVMVHGSSREVVAGKTAQLAELLGEDNHGHLVLHSTRILKKTGLRIIGS